MKSKQPIPPKFAERFLLWFLRDDLAEEVLGDLDEQFYAMLEESSALKAKLNYWYQVFHYLRPFAIRNSKSLYSNHNHYSMYRSYFKIFWRNLINNKAHASGYNESREESAVRVMIRKSTAPGICIANQLI